MVLRRAVCILLASVVEVASADACQNPLLSPRALLDLLNTHTHSLCRPPDTGAGTPLSFLANTSKKVAIHNATFSCAIPSPEWRKSMATGAPLTSLWQCNGTDVRLTVTTQSPDDAQAFQVDALCPNGLSTTHTIPQDLRMKYAKVRPPITVHDGSTESRADKVPDWCAMGDDTEVLDGVTLVIPHEDFWNLFESFHSLFSTFVTLRVFNLGRVRQIVFLSKDARARQPVRRIWRQMFAHRLIFPDAGSPTFCVRNAIFPFPSSLSPMVAGRLPGGVECPVLPLVRHYADAFLAAFNVTHATPARSHEQGRTRVVILSRADRTQVFRRIMSNIKELAEALRRHGKEHLSVEIYAPSDHTIDEQVRKVSQGADILIAAHGASLMDIIALPLCSGVVECGTGADMHYWNLAHMLGDARVIYKYLPGSMSWGDASFTADIPKVLDAVGAIVAERAACISRAPLHEKKRTPLSQSSSPSPSALPTSSPSLVSQASEIIYSDIARLVVASFGLLVCFSVTYRCLRRQAPAAPRQVHYETVGLECKADGTEDIKV